MSNNIQGNILTHGLTLAVYLQNFGTTFDIGTVHHDLTVEAAGTQQRRVQNIRTVGSSNHNDALISAKAIHLYQQLVQGLLALVMATAKTSATLTTYSIDFIDEHNTGSALFRLVKQVAHAGSTHAYKHFYEVRARNTEEGHACFAGHSLRQQGFTSTRRAIQQHALGNLSTQLIIFLRTL